MSTTFRRIRTLLAIIFGIQIVLLIVIIASSSSGWSNGEYALTIIAIVALAILFITNLVCLITDNPWFVGMIFGGMGGGSGFFSKIGSFFAVLGGIIAAPFVGLFTLIVKLIDKITGKDSKGKKGREKKVKQRKYEVDPRRVRFNSKEDNKLLDKAVMGILNEEKKSQKVQERYEKRRAKEIAKRERYAKKKLIELDNYRQKRDWANYQLLEKQLKREGILEYSEQEKAEMKEREERRALIADIIEQSKKEYGQFRVLKMEYPYGSAFDIVAHEFKMFKDKYGEVQIRATYWSLHKNKSEMDRYADDQLKKMSWDLISKDLIPLRQLLQEYEIPHHLEVEFAVHGEFDYKHYRFDYWVYYNEWITVDKTGKIIRRNKWSSVKDDSHLWNTR